MGILFTRCKIGGHNFAGIPQVYIFFPHIPVMPAFHNILLDSGIIN